MSLVRRITHSPKLKQLKPASIRRSVTAAFDEDTIFVKWYERPDGKGNFGDDLNPWLVSRLSGKTPVNSRSVLNLRGKPVYSCIGSILGNCREREHHVWGTGFMHADDTVRVRPRQVHAVRGPLTRQRLLDLGIDCPEVYGDPALLLPCFYHPETEQRYALGIIAHYADRDHSNYLGFIDQLPDTVRLIDIEGPVEAVVDSILSCQRIASSSLHGLIAADAYGIPSLYIRFSDQVSGGSFKFRDYMGGVNRAYCEPVQIDAETTVEDVLGRFGEYTVQIDLDALLSNCPFYLK